ncbi:MAG: RNase adapter RapZ [Acidobacteriota bacterium]|nr:RNase adapter RapZ [Blastocatellia bacterium]MDW8238510.1 RNase adapter RapZ [Acidobacteriota bacterium]
MASPHIVIITGLSGSGKTSAVKAFEDLGYFCVDNLPIQLIPTFVQLCDRSDETLSRAVIVVDIREKEFLPEFPHIYETLKKRNIHLTVLFFEANDETIRRRFSETRRPHPLSQQKKHLAQSIAAERALLAPLRALADMVVDTSDRNVHALRQYLIEQFSGNGRRLEMHILIVSFGYKHGLPPNMDLLFDVRFLPNPHFVPELRPLTGKHPQVAAYMNQSPETQETLRRLQELLEFLLPHYRREGRSYLTIGIGCTGGRHRSVMVAEALRRFLRRKGYKVKVQHRDWKKFDMY